MNVPTFTVAVTDANGNTVAAVGGVSASRAATVPAVVSTPSGGLAYTGARTQIELAIAAGLVVAGAALVRLGRNREQRAH